MSEKWSNSHSKNRSKTSSCHDVDNGKPKQVSPLRAAFEELQNEIERDLQNSERVLSAANDYLGSTSRNCPNRRNPYNDETECSSGPRVEESFLRFHQIRPPDPVNMKKSAMRVNLPCDNRSIQSVAEDDQIGNSYHHHHHHHHRHHHHHNRNHYEYYQERDSGLPKLNEKSLRSISHLSKLKNSSSHNICELDKGSEVFRVCNSKPKEKKKAGVKVVKLPEAPPLIKEQIQELIRCETQDVESAWYLASEEKKTFKKPCPKKQISQLRVKTSAQSTEKSSGTCGKKYSRLEHPDPEDISPDVAAAMMFLQEQGLKMDECPDDTITRLFPQDPRPALPEKGSVSVVNPSGSDQQKMMEKSAAVPSEGVSDSAYTRRMAGKGELGPQKSYDVDFVIGQTKREYVFVTEKPQRVNMVRFRGGSTPSWFPWYLSAFPDDEEGLKLGTSPSGLFYKAWLYSNPENIPPNDVIVLD